MTSTSKAHNIFREEFENIILDYNTISIQEKNNLIEKFKKNNKIKEDKDINLENIINIKNKIYSKDIFIIMNGNIKINIKRVNNIQSFLDATPPNKNKYKLLAFNKELYKTIICNLTLIQNENKEVFITLFKYLVNKYDWITKRISIGYSRAELNIILHGFPEIEIIPCFYHFMSNIIKHFK